MGTRHVRRQLPRWSDLRPLVRIEPPVWRRDARLRRAASISDLRVLARRRTPRAAFDYVDGAAEAELSHTRSREAFARVEFRPRVLRDVSDPDLGTTLLGRSATMPLILAPTGFTRMMHHEGEYAVGAAAADAGVPYTLSTMGTVTPEQLAAAGGDADRWFQLYLWKDRGATKDLVARAAASGYRALVLTVDTPVSGARLRDVRNGLTIPPNLTLRTLAGMGRHPSWWFNLLTTPPLTFASLSSTDGALAEMVDRVFDPRITIADLEWLRDVWKGPLVVKGIQDPADARMVVDAGADAVVVSNHGGRQLDRAVTPIEQLPAMVDAIRRTGRGVRRRRCPQWSRRHRRRGPRRARLPRRPGIPLRTDGRRAGRSRPGARHPPRRHAAHARSARRGERRPARSRKRAATPLRQRVPVRARSVAARR